MSVSTKSVIYAARQRKRRSLAVVVLAAGGGTRMKSKMPKILHAIAGKSMVAHVLDAVSELNPEKIVGVIQPGADAVVKAFAPHTIAVQRSPRGTADAVMAALPALGAFRGYVLVVYGDSPLLTASSLRRLVETCRCEGAAVGVLGFKARDPSPYGRLIVENGMLEKIVEAKDATAAQAAVDFVNSGVMCIDAAHISRILGAIGDDNASREFYLTDSVAIARASGLRALAVSGSEEEFQGVNCRRDLAIAERAFQDRLRDAALSSGVTMTAPETVWLSADTKFGTDVTIGPNVRFGPGVVVASRVRINGFCDIEGAKIGEGAIVGPFARLRSGSDVGEEVHIGNFVELKATRMERGAKANHLAYLGDSDIGAGSNIGAGTIFVNYDGYGKHRTIVGVEAFVGSNVSLIAPVRVGDRANVTAGSVITEDVAAESLAFGRARQVNKTGQAAPLRVRLRTQALAAKKVLG